jgi:hypothetical protein
MGGRDTGSIYTGKISNNINILVMLPDIRMELAPDCRKHPVAHAACRKKPVSRWYRMKHALRFRPHIFHSRPHHFKEFFLRINVSGHRSGTRWWEYRLLFVPQGAE